MKKLLSLLLICISALGLTACDWGTANEDYNEHILIDRVQFTSVVYCTDVGSYGNYTYKTYPCYGCKSWFVDDQFSVASGSATPTIVDISGAYSVSCTVIDADANPTPHVHYCVTWVKEKN